ncbi:conserved hypothetical protein [Roseibium sp. TrichSKD4]|nr:conserved hypothetical protein [Roseibium sp. TrichSKD4]
MVFLEEANVHIFDLLEEKMRSTFTFLLLLLSSPIVFAGGSFPQDLKFTNANCASSGICILATDFVFIGPNLVWQADKGNKTDGASIPSLLQGGIIGNSFDEDLIKAAVIHDHYCDRRVRSWYKTHRVFYDALVADGMSKARAKLLYTGVLVGGPKWLTVIQGKSCGYGQACINNTVGVPTTFIKGTDHSDEAKERFEKIAEQVEQNDDISLEEIFELVKQEVGPDSFLDAGDTLELRKGFPSQIKQ